MIAGATTGAIGLQLSDYWRLTKPDVNFMIGITTLAGFLLGESSRTALLPRTVFATLLVAAGAGALNQYVEREYDAGMRRTLRRPIAAGRVPPVAALRFGIGLSIVGILWLALADSPLASVVALFTLISYLFVYTPLKRRTPLCVLVGAIPGAMPPLIGCAAATGELDSRAWALAVVLFLWQLPHVMAIAWMYREDYDRAGYQVLPRNQSRWRWVFWQTLLPLIALIPLALITGRGSVYHTGALIFSAGFLFYGIRFLRRKGLADARKVLFASIVYLPCLFLLAVLTK